MDERGKRFLNFLLLKPAFTSRHLFSIFLVVLLVGVYLASGGRVFSLPRIKPGGQFGTVERPQTPAVEEVTPSSRPSDSSLFGQDAEKTGEYQQEAPIQRNPLEQPTNPAERLELLKQRLKQSQRTQ